MKTLFYTLVILSILSLGCRSIEKMVDEGRYDDAIYLATEKLAGKKNKKTKHIQALEEAFSKVNLHDVRRIQYLESLDDASVWDEVHEIATRIAWRQDRIKGFLPLISKDGYVADFDFINTNQVIDKAASSAAAYHYNRGIEKLKKARTIQSKWLARESYNNLLQAQRYFQDYNDVRQLIVEAEKIGTVHVLLKWEDQFQRSIPGHVYDVGMDVYDLNQRWTAFYTYHPGNINLDQVATIKMQDYYISPEREEVTNLVERRTIENWVDATDRRGRTLRDSSGNVIQILQTEEVEAYIREIRRNKNLAMNGFIELIDYSTGDLVTMEPWEVNIHFSSDACRISGDRRALTEATRKRQNDRIEPFPSDFTMTTEAITSMNQQSFQILEKINWNQGINPQFASQ